MSEHSVAGSKPEVPSILELQNLHVRFFTRRGVVQAVRGASFRVRPGESMALVGESGSGKSVMMKSILGLVRSPGRITEGDILWKGKSLLGEEGKHYAREVIGKKVTIVFQDPMASLNPLLTVGSQIGEVLRRHQGMTRDQAKRRTLELLDLVEIATPKRRIKQYPHEFSGGMKQRVMIAMALAPEPELLIADEPTTALDVTIQAHILELLAEIQGRLGLAVLLVTHDLGIVARLCHRIAVMYGGKIVEGGSADQVFGNPGHPYTEGLLRSSPRLDSFQERLQAIEGSPVDLIDPPPGCPFNPRCPRVVEDCIREMPRLEQYEWSREVACWRAFDEG